MTANNFVSLKERILGSLWGSLVGDALKAVNLGGDADTTGCVTGGLAGLIYDIKGIPQEWIAELPHKEDLDLLLNKFAGLCV